MQSAQNAAANAVELVGIQHQLVGIEDELPKNNEENREEQHGHGREEYGFLVQKVHDGNIKKAGPRARRLFVKCKNLVKGVLVDLAVLEETVNAESGQNENCRNDQVLDDFAHVFSPVSLYFKFI